MVPNVWTQRKAPPKRGQVYGFLRKKGYWSSATGQFRARGSVPSAGTLATGVLPQSNRSGATDRRPATTKRSATNHTSFSSRYSACACTHHCAAPVLGG